jgi:hypothetical protein
MDCDDLATRLRRAADTDPVRAKAAGVFDALADYEKGKRKEGALRHALERFAMKENPMAKTRLRDARGKYSVSAAALRLQGSRVQEMRAAARRLIREGLLPKPSEHPRVAVNYRESDPDSGIVVVYPSAAGFVEVQFSASGWYEGSPDILGIWDPAMSAFVHEGLARPNPRSR